MACGVVPCHVGFCYLALVRGAHSRTEKGKKIPHPLEGPFADPPPWYGQKTSFSFSIRINGPKEYRPGRL